jgi:hypothetical protein
MIDFDTSNFGSFKLSSLASFRNNSTRSTRSLNACLTLDLTAPILFGSSGLGSFNFYTLIPPGVLSTEDNGFPPRVLLDLMVYIFSAPANFLLECYASKLLDLSPRFLRNRRLRSSFNLWEFGSLSHSSLGILQSDFP